MTANPDILELAGRYLEGELLPFMARFVAEGSHFAAGMALFLIVTASTLIALILIFRVIPSWLSLNIRRRKLVALFKSAKTLEERRQLFAAEFGDTVDPAMGAGFQSGFSRAVRTFLVWVGKENELRLAWSEFKETFIDETDEREIRNTERPHGYFMRAISNPQKYAGLAGLFVSIGLLLTFIGIIAVLMKAGCEMPSGGGVSTVCMSYNVSIHNVELALGTASGTAPTTTEPGQVDDAQVRGAVISIVGGAASKFYASIGGLAASILLRAFIGIFSFGIRRETEKLSDAIESGLAFLPEQRLALQQLKAVEEQSTQLKTFNTELAVALSDAMEPVATQLGNIERELTDQRGNIATGVGDAVNKMAGGEIRELGRVLGDLRSELSGLSGKLTEGGDAAAQQMSDASTALGAIAERMQEEFQEITKQARDAGADANNELLEAAKGVRETIASSLGEMNAAGAANAERLGAIGDTLTNLTKSLGETAHEEFTAAIEKSAARTAMAAEEAGETLKAAMDDASENWMSSVSDAVSKMQTLGDQMGRSTTAAERHAATMDRAAEATDQAGAAISTAATAIKGATEPLTPALQQLKSAANSVETAVNTLSTSSSTAIERAEELARSMADTARAAEEAWASYKGRFGEVDDQLEAVLTAMSSSLESNSERMRDYVEQIDSELAKAVSNFASAVQPLNDIAEELEEASLSIKRQSEVESAE
jgi:ABC-type transporter Mla subunit MlaD